MTPKLNPEYSKMLSTPVPLVLSCSPHSHKFIALIVQPRRWTPQKSDRISSETNRFLRWRDLSAKICPELKYRCLLFASGTTGRGVSPHRRVRSTTWQHPLRCGNVSFSSSLQALAR